jgi:uncharacterized small protein (TIGR04563 family)
MVLWAREEQIQAVGLEPTAGEAWEPRSRKGGGTCRIPPRRRLPVIYFEGRRGTSARPNTKVGKGQMDERDAKAKKQSLYFPQEMLEEIKAEAVRLERSLSWVVQRAWKRAREEIRKTPAG